MLLDLAVLGLALFPAFFLQLPSPTQAGDAVQFERLNYRDRVESDGSQVREIEVEVRLGTAQGVAELGQIGVPFIDGYGDVRFEEVQRYRKDPRTVDPSLSSDYDPGLDLAC